MLEAQLSISRKRRNSEQPAHVSKRRKRNYLGGSQLPPAFWDNLSKIDLTKRALEELDRRNTQAALDSQPPHLRPDRRITRRVLAELKKSAQPLTPPAEYLCHCGTSGLRSIQRTARHGGPDLSDLRGLPKPSSPPNPAMNSSRSSSRSKRKSTSSPSIRPSSSTTNTASTASTGPYNRNFQQYLIDGGVYPPAYTFPDGRVPAKPDNWEEINRRLSKPRPSLSPSKFSEETHEKFVQADAGAAKEQQVIEWVIPYIEGSIKDAKCVSGGIPFTNLAPLTDGTLVPGNPDIYHGARPEQLDRRVRDELGGHIIPSTQGDLPIAPNFFLEVKGPDGSAAVAKRQASYNGAFGARGTQSLQSYGRETLSYDNNAYTITSTYHDGTLKMFTSHPTQPTGSGIRPKYNMHQVKGWSITSDSETFRQGATYYRNGRDWAKEQRDKAIGLANTRVGEAHVMQASSFASEATSDVTTIEARSEESQTSRTEESNPNTLTSEASSGEPPVDHRPTAKRSSELLTSPPRPQRKRRDARDSNYDHSQQSGLQLSKSSGLS